MLKTTDKTKKALEDLEERWNKDIDLSQSAALMIQVIQFYNNILTKFCLNIYIFREFIEDC